MTFAKVVGQEKLKSQLLDEIQHGRLSHARLFSGKEGVGKMALALAVAQYINCESPTTNDACGSCPSCIKYQKLIHPDLHFVFPIVKVGNKTPVCDDFIEPWREFVLENRYVSLNNWYKQIGLENKQGVIYEKESNEILRKLSHKSYEGKYKIVIIWQAEKMNHSCANKLLKIIEEPPKGTIFFLLTESPEDILPTVYSRCQNLNISPISNDKLTEYLTGRGVEKSIIDEILPLADGSLTNALRLVEERDELQFNFEEFKNIMRLTYAVNVPGIYEWTERMAKLGREKQKQFLDYCSRLIRENFMYNLRIQNLYKITPKEEQFSTKFAPFINAKNVEALYEDFSKAYSDISANGNPKIVFMDLGIQVTRRLKTK
ncbi:DNA polymerase-3 subunit delta' [Balneicella halophila]|uniref:DNA polymerase-3 subunit delta n=1 Tax=Balneicella halophila TaxID=1537566 RepID=A0A7L4UNL2_BALHA|nr:DNA polymerase III subunit delta' [Balneicella halophila]PVX50770.1 DNA polymerase-3 subunit delta' [Balneicella halophila]